MIRCNNGDCVLASQRCDRIQDCADDGSDEMHCGKFTPNEEIICTIFR